MKANEKQITRYLVVVLFFSILAYVTLILTEGRYLTSIFQNVNSDTFMDFFNSLDNQNVDPYLDRNSNYPAFACILFKLFLHIIPKNLRSGGGLSYRDLNYSLMIFVLVFMVTLWAILNLIRYKFEIGKLNGALLSLTILLCSPMIYLLERGNIIIISFLFALIYVLFYEENNRILREIAYISLAISAAIKIYPAILGLILIKKKYIFGTIRTIIYGALLFFVPFFYYNGFTSIKVMISGISTIGNWPEKLGYGYNVSFYNIMETITAMLGFKINPIIIYIFEIIFVILLIYSFAKCNMKWIELLSIIMMIILIPKTNFYYILIFLLIPFIEYLKEVHSVGFNTKLKKLYSVLFALILIPLPIGFAMQRNFQYPVGIGCLINYFTIIAFSIVTISLGIFGKTHSEL